MAVGRPSAVVKAGADVMHREAMTASSRRRLGGISFFGQKVLHQLLESRLQANEILDAFSGYAADNKKMNVVGTALARNAVVILGAEYNKIMVPNRLEIEIPIDRISAIDAQTKVLSKLTIVGSGIDYQFVRVGSGPRFAQTVRGLIAKASGAKSSTQVEGDLTAQLDRLASLHAAGALDDDEFRAAKKRLLGG